MRSQLVTQVTSLDSIRITHDEYAGITDTLRVRHMVYRYRLKSDVDLTVISIYEEGCTRLKRHKHTMTRCSGMR